MAWWGKMIGGTLGFMLGGHLGALFGIALGHQHDQAGRRPGIGASGTEQTQAAFFTATFAVMGHIAKADGRVSPEEIAMARTIIRQMRLNQDQQEAAIKLFQQGKAADFPLDAILHQLRTTCHARSNLLRMFLEIQIQAAMADGRIDPAERRILEHISRSLGFDPSVLEELLWLDPNTPHTSLADDYRTLGVADDAADAEIKKAYRRLMNRHHPDKLIAKGMPEEMVRIATEKTQQIQTAYARIRESRKPPLRH